MDMRTSGHTSLIPTMCAAIMLFYFQRQGERERTLTQCIFGKAESVHHKHVQHVHKIMGT